MRVGFISRLMLVLMCAVTACSLPGQAQRPVSGKHRIILEVTVAGADAWKAILRNVRAVQTVFGVSGCEIEVVGHGPGIGMMLNSNAERDAMRALTTDTGVVFAACANSLRLRNIRREEVLPFCVVVDSAYAELVRKQEAGWVYIKAGL